MKSFITQFSDEMKQRTNLQMHLAISRATENLMKADEKRFQSCEQMQNLRVKIEDFVALLMVVEN